VAKLIARLIGVEVRCETILDPALGRVLADHGQLEQVLVNLAVNARDAMPDGGTLTIETAHVFINDREARQLGGSEDAQPGDYVLLAVTDTGQGMSRATQARIFDPFFTTKEPGKGTGLGLSTVYGIVRQSGGFISAYSEIDHGTTFRIYLPRVESEVRVQPSKPASRSLPDGSATIMLVDDDDAVRNVASRILSRAGYALLVASSPQEAERLWTGHEGEIDLLMTDLMMPDMNGGELAERLLSSRPNARVLYTSGYTSETVVRGGLVVGEVPFLAKPFTIDAVLKKVREVLDQ
jgi:CheY-like chemotaxis protein